MQKAGEEEDEEEGKDEGAARSGEAARGRGDIYYSVWTICPVNERRN